MEDSTERSWVDTEFPLEEEPDYPRIISHQFQTVPYHVIIMILEYYPPINFSQVSSKSFNEISKSLFGYFKHDRFRKIFLIFKNVWINDSSLCRYFPKGTRSMLIHPTKWEVLESLPPELETLFLSIDTTKLLETIEKDENKTFIPSTTLKTIDISLIVSQGVNWEFNNLIDYLPSDVESFSLRYCLRSFRGPEHSKSFKFARFRSKFQQLKHLRLDLQNAIEICHLNDLCHNHELILSLELDGNFKIHGSFSVFQNIKRLKLKGLTKEFGIEIVHPKVTFNDSFPFDSIQSLYFRYVVNCSHFLTKMIPEHRIMMTRLESFTHEYFTDPGVLKMVINHLPSSVANIKLYNTRNQLRDDHFSPQFATNVPKLGKLELGYAAKLTGSCFPNFPRFIEVIDFTNCLGLKDEWFARLPNLECLKVANFENTKIGKSLRIVLQKAKRLEKLKLVWCSDIRDEYFLYDDDEGNVNEDKMLLNRMEKLVELKIGCKHVTDKIIRHLPPSLEIFFGECCQFTNEGMNFLPSNLRFLILSRLENISDEIFDLIQDQLLRLELLSIGLSKSISRSGELKFVRKKRKGLKLYTYGNKE